MLVPVISQHHEYKSHPPFWTDFQVQDSATYTRINTVHPIASLTVQNLVDSIIYTCLVTDTGNIHPIAGLTVLNLVDSIIYTDSGNIHPIAGLTVLNLVDSIIYTDSGNIHPIAGLAVLNLVDSIIYTCLVTVRLADTRFYRP